MKRETYLTNLVIQLNNPIQPPQWGAPVITTSASIVLDINGQPKYQPAYSQTPTTPEDITDEVLRVLQEQLAEIGLTVGRLGGEL